MKQTRLAFLGAALALVLVGAMWLAATLKRAPSPVVAATQEDAGPFKKNELQAWIRLLSSADPKERQRAESDLANAGAFADAAIKEAQANASGDAKEALQRLSDRRRFAGLQDLDYAKALPSTSLLYVHVPDIQNFLGKVKQSPFGMLAQRPAFEAQRKKLWDALQHDEHGELRQPPTDYFKGQFAAALFQTTPGKLETNTKFGVLLELKGADPQGEYLDWSGTLLKNGGKLEDYKNIETLNAGPQKGAHARTGDSLLFGSDADALHALIDTVLGDRSVKTSPEVKEVRDALHISPTSAPDAFLFVDVPTIANQLLQAKSGARQPGDDLAELVLEKLGYLGASCTSKLDCFDDRIVCLLPEGPGAIAIAFAAPVTAPAPLAALQNVPADALAAAVIYADGAQFQNALEAFYTDLRNRRGAETLPPMAQAHPFVALHSFEHLLGLKDSQLLSLLKGELVVWLQWRTTDHQSATDLSGMLTAVDAKSAEELSTLLNKLNALVPATVPTQSTYAEHTLHWVHAPLRGEPENTLTWTVDANRLYFAQSLASMKRQIDTRSRHLPGLLKREPLQALLPAFSAAEQRGSVLYIDTQALLTRYAETGFVILLCDPATPVDLKETLMQLPPATDLFKNFPPLLAFVGTRGDRAELVARSPLPLVPIALLALIAQREKHPQSNPLPKKK